MSAKPPTNGLAPRTLAAQALGWEEAETHAVVTPIHVATTFIRDPDNQYRNGFVYGRPDNQTVRQCEAVLTALEEGAEAMLLGSGMSAATPSSWRCRRAHISSRRRSCTGRCATG
jgi:cystathionine gamma-synthase